MKGITTGTGITPPKDLSLPAARLGRMRTPEDE